MIADSLVRQFKTIAGDANAWTDAADLHTYSYDAAVAGPGAARADRPARIDRRIGTDGSAVQR